MLEGLRVVELSADVAGALAGRLLATYGAEVIVVEPPAGHPIRSLPPWPSDRRDPEESILFAALGAGKRSVALDIESPADRDRVARLIETAEVVIDSHAPGALASRGLDLRAMVEARPDLVVTQITPFGQSGPRSSWRVTALTAYAAGGQMAMCGDADQPPLKTAGHQAMMQAGLHAFSATLTALYAARATGVGDVLDISIQEVQVQTLEGSGPNALVRGTDAGRTSGNAPFAQWGIHPCKDGWIGVAAMPRQSFSVYECIGHPELKDDPDFASGWSPAANEVLKVLIPEWTSQYTAREIFEMASRYRAPFAMIPTPRELLEWQHFQEIDFWQWVEHPRLGRHPLPGGPIEFGEGDRGAHRRAPLTGEHTDEVLASLPNASERAPVAGGAAETPPLPLEGVRVIDVTQVWAGPYGTRLLADMGADVIKVEGPSFADPVRTMAGARDVPDINLSAYFNEYNRNKRGVSLDLKQPEGIEALKRLIATADVFIENWSSGVAERMGLGYDDLKRLKPDIIYVSMPGFGHRGPDAQRVGFGPTIEQMGGLVALQGYEGGPPHRSGISYGDPIGGTTAAGAVAIGLLHRQRTGEGLYAVTPQRDGIVNLIGEYVIAEVLGSPLPTRIGSRDAFFAPHNVYRCRDSEPRPAVAEGISFTDRWVTIAVDSDGAWQALKGVIGDSRLDEPAYETREGRHEHQRAIDGVIEEWTLPRDADDAAAELQAAGVSAVPVLTPFYATIDAHLLARDNFLEYDHPDAGLNRTTRPAWRLRRRPVTSVRHAPPFGADSVEVLRDIAGYSDAEIEALQAKEVTTTHLLGGG